MALCSLLHHVRVLILSLSLLFLFILCTFLLETWKRREKKLVESMLIEILVSVAFRLRGNFFSLAPIDRRRYPESLSHLRSRPWTTSRRATGRCTRGFLAMLRGVLISHAIILRYCPFAVSSCSSMLSWPLALPCTMVRRCPSRGKGEDEDGMRTKTVGG